MEVANELSIAKVRRKIISRPWRCVSTLCEREEVPTRPKHLKYGRHVLSKVEIAQNSGPVIDHIVHETGEKVWTAIEEHGQAVCVKKALEERAVLSRGGIGERVDLHSSAVGKALLANPHRTIPTRLSNTEGTH